MYSLRTDGGMSQVLSEFDSALRTAVTEPLYILLVFVAGIGASIVSLVLAFIPLVGPLVNGVVLTPVLLVATLGSAHAVRHGKSAIDGATDALERATVNVMGAYVILAAGYVGFLLVLGIVASVTVLTGTAYFPSMEGASTLANAGSVVALIVAFVIFCLALAAAMAVQFIAPAAVVAGTGAVDSLKTAYRFFRRNVLGVAGFSLVLAGLSIVCLLVAGLFYFGGRAIDPNAGLALGVLGYLAMFAVLGVVTPLYQVGYFEAAIDDAALPADHEWPDDSDDDGTDAATVGTVSQAGSDDDESAEPKPQEENTGGFAIEMSDDEDDDENGASNGEPSENGSDGERR